MYLWHRAARIDWVKTHDKLLQVHAHGQLVTIRRPGHKLLQLEIVCNSLKASRRLVAEFGGHVERLPRNWFERFALEESKPIKIGHRLIVARLPAVKLPKARPFLGKLREPKILVVPASMAFGTGEHVTTAMSLRLLEELTRQWKRGWSIVDLGTGTGILALAASLFGATRVLGLDSDPAAIAVAKSNARLNKIRGVSFQVTDACKWKSPYAPDVVTANLYSELLIQILPNLKRCVLLIVSGILRSQETAFVGALRRNEMKIARVRRRGKWIALLAVRRGTVPAREHAHGQVLRSTTTPATVWTDAK